jgi:hypothetical protein
MRRTLFVAVAAVAIGCGGQKNVSNATQSGGSTQSMAGSTAGGETRSPANPSSPGNEALSNQLVTLTGCLKGGEAAAGSAPSSNTSTRSPAGDGGNSGMNRFVLTHAMAEPGSNGVGAGGAGASGGPLVSGASDYLLQGGDITELRGHVGHQVRISARLNPQQISQPQGTSAGTATTADSTSAGGTAASGAAHVPRAIPGNGTNGAPGSAATGVQSLIVESVQMVAATCAQS